MFMQRISDELGVPPLALTEGVMLKLASYDWPGNVRELRNLIERSLILGEFPPEFSDDTQGDELAADSLAAVERRHILNVFKRQRWQPCRGSTPFGCVAQNHRSQMRHVGCVTRPSRLALLGTILSAPDC